MACDQSSSSRSSNKRPMTEETQQSTFSAMSSSSPVPPSALPSQTNSQPFEPTNKSKNRSFKRNLMIKTPTHSIDTRTKANKLRNIVANNQRSPSPRLLKESRQNQETPLPFIEINTFEIFQTIIQSTNSDDIFCLKVCLFDVDAVGRQYCLGIGYLQTASLYFQALRLLFSDSNEIPSTIDSLVELYDPIRSTVIAATVMIKLKFEISSVPSLIIDYLKSFKQYYQSINTGSSFLYGRAELGLKQAFQIADRNGSGGISSSELVTVIEGINTRKKKNHKDISKAVIGLDESVQALLLQLIKIVNGKFDSEDNRNDDGDDGDGDDGDGDGGNDQGGGEGRIQKEEILQLFQLMDLDGDGNISWWEWRQVLENTSIVTILHNQHLHENNEDEPISPLPASSTGVMLDLLDPLLITLEAAHGYLVSINGGVIISKPKKLTSDNFLNNFEDNEKIQLQNEVNELKQKTKSLQNKLQSAIKNSEGYENGEDPGAPPPSTTSPKRENKQLTELLSLVEMERNQRLKLEQELEKIKQNSEEMTRTQSELTLESERNKRRLQLESERLRLEVITTFLARKTQENAWRVMKRFLLQVRTRLAERKLKEAEMRLNRSIHTLLLRKRYLEMVNLRNHRVILTQNLIRRFLSRRKVRKIKESGQKISEMFQMRKMRHVAQARLKHLRLVKLFLSNLSVNRIQRAYRRYCIQKKRNQMATRIASLWRGYSIKKCVKKQMNAIVVIQRFYRGYKARGEYSSRKREQKMATLIQSLVRGSRRRSEYQVVLSKMKMASVIQRAYRSYRRRVYLKKIFNVIMRYCLKHQNLNRLHAVIKLQKMFRCWKAKKLRMKLFLSILRIQRAYRRRLHRRLRDALRAVPADMTLVEMDSPPDFENCIGYWIVRERDPTTEGYIESIRRKGRLLFVNFSQGAGNIFLTPVPYDEPNLVWFREVPIEVDEEDEKEEKESDDLLNSLESVEIVKLDAIPNIKISPGHWLIRRNQSEIRYCVDSVDIPTRMLSTRYRNSQGKVLSEKIPYDEIGLFWYRERNIQIPPPSSSSSPSSPDPPQSNDTDESVEILSAPPPIERAAGHWISVEESSENGLVDRVNYKTRVMSVIYENGNQEVSYDQPNLVWMK